MARSGDVFSCHNMRGLGSGSGGVGATGIWRIEAKNATRLSKVYNTVPTTKNELARRNKKSCSRDTQCK